jgi:CRP-like cAMP-binding protein
MPDGATRAEAASRLVPALRDVPLLAGVAEPDLQELAGVLRRRELAAGELLWREGEDAHGMVVVVAGRVAVSVRLPGDRAADVASMGPGEVLGEIPLLDGGRHSATARAAEDASILVLSRADFAGLVSRRHPSASALKRAIAAVACDRLRQHVRTLAASLEAGPDGTAPRGAGTAARPPMADLEPSDPPDSGYVRRLAAFRSFDGLALWGLLTAGRFVRCAAGRTLIAEGAVSDTCFVTLNGAVEKVVVRGDRRIRVGLAGPGLAFGYESLIDGGPSPTTAATRERTLLLALPEAAFQRLFGGESAGSHEFLDVVNRDLMAALRQALRPHARLAASR